VSQLAYMHGTQQHDNPKNKNRLKNIKSAKKYPYSRFSYVERLIKKTKSTVVIYGVCQ